MAINKTRAGQISIEDRAKRTELSANGSRRLHGHVKIELFNAKTGEIEQTTEGHNIVTNTVENAFASDYMGRLGYDAIKPIYNKFFGGLLCFRHAITESADTMYIPTSAANPIVAHAGQTTYESAAADLTRGNPNDYESGPITNGYKFVWDFATTQGNGIIEALGMTNPDTGDFFPNLPGDYHVDIATLSTDIYTGTQALPMLPRIFDDANKRSFNILVKNASTITIREYPSYGVIKNVGLLQPASVTSIEAAHTDTDISVTNAARSFWFLHNGDLILMVPDSNTLTRYTIDLATKTYTTDTISVSLPTGGSFNLTNNHLGRGGVVSYSAYREITPSGRMFIMGANNKAYIIDYDNPSDVQEITCPAVCLSDVIALGEWFITAYGYEKNKAFITDGYITKIVNYYNQSSSTYSYQQCYYRAAKTIDSAIRLKSGCSYDSLSSWYTQCELYKLFLSTAKNLDEPVSKTATQTMKITYTITEAQDEG